MRMKSAQKMNRRRVPHGQNQTLRGGTKVLIRTKTVRIKRIWTGTAHPMRKRVETTVARGKGGGRKSQRNRRPRRIPGPRSQELPETRKRVKRRRGQRRPRRTRR